MTRNIFFESDYGYSIDIKLSNVPTGLPSDVVPQVLVTRPDGTTVTTRTGSADGITYNSATQTIAMTIRQGVGDLSPPGKHRVRVRLLKDTVVQLTSPTEHVLEVRAS